MAKANARAKTSFLIIIPPSLRLIQVLTVTLAKPRIRAGHFNEAEEGSYSPGQNSALEF
jgi:hypothetical protein